MNLLRIRGSLVDSPLRCPWVLFASGREARRGETPLTELPQRADCAHLVVPAAQVLITRTHLPPSASRRAGALLAYAIEDKTLGEPDANQVSWLGSAGDADVLAVVDKAGLKRWMDAIKDVGALEVHCETLLLPWVAGEWSLAWDGREGFVRTSEIEGAATDCGDERSPPLSLRLMLEAAAATGTRPHAIAVYLAAPDSMPDFAVWEREIGITLRLAGNWDWRTALPDAKVSLLRERRRWRALAGVIPRLKPAAWIVAAALAIHALALVTDWALLASEQHALRRQMEASFRAAFPDAIAVVDPALQMRRKLAEARHAAGQSDSGDFLPLVEMVAAAVKELQAGSLRIASYENGRLTLEFAAIDESTMRRIAARLVQIGLSVDTSPVFARSGRGKTVITVRAS